jgi:hypothetical protein
VSAAGYCGSHHELGVQTGRLGKVSGWEAFVVVLRQLELAGGNGRMSLWRGVRSLGAEWPCDEVRFHGTRHWQGGFSPAAAQPHTRGQVARCLVVAGLTLRFCCEFRGLGRDGI